jgi:hypothetical protein
VKNFRGVEGSRNLAVCSVKQLPVTKRRMVHTNNIERAEKDDTKMTKASSFRGALIQG